MKIIYWREKKKFIRKKKIGINIWKRKDFKEKENEKENKKE